VSHLVPVLGQGRAIVDSGSLLLTVVLPELLISGREEEWGGGETRGAVGGGSKERGGGGNERSEGSVRIAEQRRERWRQSMAFDTKRRSREKRERERERERSRGHSRRLAFLSFCCNSAASRRWGSRGGLRTCRCGSAW